MLDFDEARKIKRRVQSRLFAIPGVHAVGVGHKIVNGQPTDELAIMVFVVKKKPLSALATGEIIPAEIEGVKTDVYESEIPRPFQDDDRYRPLRGGVKITRGGPTFESAESPGSGTLGFIARQDGPVPKIFAVTCHHVVGFPPPGQGSKLTIALAPRTITFGGDNTPGTLIVVSLDVTPSGATDPDHFDVFYVTSRTDTVDTIASVVSDRINTTHVEGISAAVTPGSPSVVTLTAAAGFQLTHFTEKYTAHLVDDSARLQSRVEGNQIALAGVASDPGGAFVNLNLGGDKPSIGVFAALKKGAVPPDNATSVEKAITDRFGTGAIGAIASGSTVTITGAQEVECDVFTDLRVGQPSPCFCSICSACCDRRIGRVVNARLDIDTALIQLDPGTKYRAEIVGIDGPIIGIKPVTQSKARVRKRGFMTGLTHGTIIAVEQDGDIIEHDQLNNPPQWQMFQRHYTEAFTISSGFAAPGDSGSAVLDEDSNNIMGLLFGGSPSMAIATPIEQITAGMSIVVETADQAGQDKTVPAGAAAGAPLGTIPAFARPLMARIQEARREIVATPFGSALAAAIERHGEEALRLANTNRRVATVWHRNGGPQMIQTALHALQSPDRQVLHEFDGKPLSACVAKIQNIFTRYASAAFAADLGEFGPRLIEFSGMSYNQFLSALQALGTPE